MTASEVRFKERQTLAIELRSLGQKDEQIAVAIYGRSDGMTIAAVRDLLRERS